MLMLICVSLVSQVVEVSTQYDGVCKPQFQTSQTCVVSLTIPRDMVPPIYVYYQLENTYMNHRRMVLSRSDGQLRGAAGADTSTCAPQRYQNGNGAGGGGGGV